MLRTHDKELYKRLVPVWDPIEIDIRRAIPHRFNFGGVGKIVLELGPQQHPQAEYRVLLNVGLLHYPDFAVHEYLSLAEEEQRIRAIAIVEHAMESLAKRFGQGTPWLSQVFSRLLTVPT